MTNDKNLTGKVAIVTGAGRNIGRAIALALADEGASVVVNVRSNKDEAVAVVRAIEANGGNATAHVGNIADAESTAFLAETAIRRFGGVDILVNNAALRGEQPFDQMSYADWRAVMDVTLDGAFHCMRACLPALKKSRGGRVVNIGGLSAHTGAKDRAHVITAKAGIVGFTRALAHDLADARITVNCVVPGLIGTPRPKNLPEPQHHLTHSTIFGDHGTPEDVATLVRFICSPAAGYITGQIIHVNGGAYLGS
jgi:3-oxoacyl-[acyl-carrier protein] reductase